MEDDANENLISVWEYDNGKSHLISICGEEVEGVSSLTSPKYEGISRVPNDLREMNAKAYEPLVLAIGPYSARDTRAFLETEGLKRRFLREFLERNEHKAVEYRSYMMRMKVRLCSFYVGEKVSDREEFLERMILDCFFVFEFLRKYNDYTYFQLFSEPLETEKKMDTIARDLLLYENQVPFFILEYLLSQHATHNFKDRVVGFIESRLAYIGRISPKKVHDYQCPHLLSLIHEAWRPNLLHTGNRHYMFDDGASATMLKDSSAVKFIRNRRKFNNLFHLEFQNGKFKIPNIIINDETDTILRNLIAYEVLTPDCNHYVSDYISLMNMLIKTTKDVELLCDHRIILDMRKDHDTVFQFFRNLECYIKYPSMELCLSYYSSMLNDVEVYRSRKRNRLKARWDSSMVVLRRDYFNSPWKFVSFLAAVILLVLTFVQTIYSVLSYYNE